MPILADRPEFLAQLGAEKAQSTKASSAITANVITGIFVKPTLISMRLSREPLISFKSIVFLNPPGLVEMRSREFSKGDQRAHQKQEDKLVQAVREKNP